MSTASDSLPPIAALFLVVFDKRVGYKIAWERSTEGFELAGVEYRSLASGLHNVETDLIYFTHEDHAGVSAFVSQPAAESERNANFAAVGVLVPLEYGRLGRAWLHAPSLRKLASYEVNDNAQKELEDYWEAHRLDNVEDGVRKDKALAEPSSPIGGSKKDSKRRSRALSEAAGFSLRDNVLADDHPAMSMPEFMDVFGPLAFPVYRAALLRKRILLIASAPVQRSCNYVYDISIFSNLSPSLGESLPSPDSLLRIKPLFNVGVHDIPELAKKKTRNVSASGEDTAPGNGWLACTTDEIIATKKELYDILIELPNADEKDGERKAWPMIKTSDGIAIKASQRDLRRYRALRRELRRMQKMQERESNYRDDDEDAVQDDNEEESAPLVRSKPGSEDTGDQPGMMENETDVVESQSWAAVMYTGFLWWASAGERDALSEEESTQDSSLLEDLSVATSNSRPSSQGSRGKRPCTGSNLPSQNTQQIAMVLIAYFHRMSTLLLETMGEIVSAADDDSEEGEGVEQIIIESEDVRRLGLDVWSPSDKQFLKEFIQLYFERESEIKGMNVECCGIKIC